jgi:hypothetical protein
MRGYFILLLVLSGAMAPRITASATFEIPLPSEFRIKASGRTEEMVFIQSIGEFWNPANRSITEAQCEAARKVGLTTRHPVFEEGHDKPTKTENQSFIRGRNEASFSTRYPYLCDRLPAPSETSADYLCGCTYRVQVQRNAYIKRFEGGRFEFISIDITKGTARRQTGVDRSLPFDPQANGAKVKGLAPEVVGQDVVAGIPCVIRRQRLGSDGWTDRCIIEDEPQKLPPHVRFRALADTTPGVDGKGTYSWMKAVKVITDASVDTGVFEMPQGVVVKEIGK